MIQSKGVWIPEFSPSSAGWPQINVGNTWWGVGACFGAIFFKTGSIFGLTQEQPYYMLPNGVAAADGKAKRPDVNQI